ncbi:MAG TPA: GMC family oxidoreductase [Kineosporiaceae bacterium]|nr:GMC family oxidoreductase [Kineosporiaceae bacterium]
MAHDFDVLVIGSGFGGSVSALRLAEKGYRVAVLEAGRRFADHEHAKTSWRLREYLFAPALGCYGIQRLTLLKHALILSGAGVGGGSLVYANTLYEPPDAFYADPQWAHITDWKAELAPYYDQAKRMLGVVENPVETDADRVLRDVAEEMGVGHTFRRTPVGILFGPPDAEPGTRVPDPFFGGAGPERTTCTLCGQCMVGCREGAKNTLRKNYLHLAEAAGVRVMPLTTAVAVRPLDGAGAARPDADGSGGYAVDIVRTGRRGRGWQRTLTAEQVVMSAAALGTQRLLHRMRDDGVLPRLSPRLGELSRTNSEAILGARSRRRTIDHSKGIAITSSIHPDAVTHIEPVRYGKGSNAMALLASVMVDGGRPTPRWLRAVPEYFRRIRDLPTVISPRHWSEQSIVLLVMQTLDNSVTVFTRRGLFGRRMTTKQGIGEPNPTWIPVGHEVARNVARRTDGVAMGTVTELIDRPITAHFIGGCPIGDSAETGVVDAYQRVYGYPGLHVVDGSAVAANLGVNPSLTITAQAERAMALWPNRGEADPRPAPGEPYQRIAPVAPRRPTVPTGANGELRLPDGRVRW